LHKLKLPILALLLGLLTLAVSADEKTAHEHYILESVAIDGTVERVMPDEEVVEINTRGIQLEVPYTNLLFYSGRQFGFDDLEPGDRVYTRLEAGLLGLEPAGANKVWITVGGEQFARIDERELDEEFLDNVEVEARYADGDTEEVEIVDAILVRAYANPLINW